MLRQGSETMLLNITTTHEPATDLGYLLHKNPARLHSIPLSFGMAHIFYPEATSERCTMTLLLDINPVDLVRDKNSAGSDIAYVNDRPYAASSFLSTAIAKAFGTALSGRCKDKPGLAEIPIPLQVTLATLPCKDGENLIKRLFAPLGYEITTIAHPLDPRFPEWGESPYYSVTITGTKRIGDLLAHLYVLIPVLDEDKHYWINQDEVDKLLRRGEGWLAQHPDRELIITRFLKRQRNLTDQALQRLIGEEGEGKPKSKLTSVRSSDDEDSWEESLSLKEYRLRAILAVLKEAGAKTVADLGCGEGNLLRVLLEDKDYSSIIGMDVSYRTLEKAHKKLKLDDMSLFKRERLKLFQGSLLYRDKRLKGFDAIVLSEVIEHLDQTRLETLTKHVFGFLHLFTVIITTPNREYNINYPQLPSGEFRHDDHRFEWTRTEFKEWAESVAAHYGYKVTISPVGLVDSITGAPTQMGVFSR